VSAARDIERVQPRGDLPQRYLTHMGPGGFRYLLEQGVVYANAQHAHANTETIVGHATLATGAHPSAHGLIGNVWFDRASGRLTYNIEDPPIPCSVPSPTWTGRPKSTPHRRLPPPTGVLLAP
jgi:hypothetical protein